MIYGSRGKIGLITPAPGDSTEYEFHKALPIGVSMLTTRMPIEAGTVESLSKLADYAEEGASLLAVGKPKLIIFGSTAGSYIKGIGYDKQIISRIEKHVGIPAITISTAVIEALKAVKAKKVSIASPHTDEVNQRAQAFIEGNGFQVTSTKGLGLTVPYQVAHLDSDEMYKLAKQVVKDDPGADTVFITCTGLTVVPIIEPLEAEIKKTVITSNQAAIWAALRRINVKDHIKGFGVLGKIQ